MALEWALYACSTCHRFHPLGCARALELAEIINAGIQPLQDRYVLQHLKRLGVVGTAFARHFVARGLGALEQAAQRSADPSLLGQASSLADALLVPDLDVARRLSVPLSKCETLLNVEAHCSQHPVFASAHPDRQPEATR